MTARYEARPVGVFDREAGQEIDPRSEGWGAYLQWLGEGNAADPMPSPAEPGRAAQVAEMAARVNGVRTTVLRGATVGADGETWDADDDSAASLLGAVLRAQRGKIADGFTWRTADNRMVPMPPERLYLIFDTVDAYRESVMRRSFELKDSTIPAAADPSAVDITAGWPSA